MSDRKFHSIRAGAVAVVVALAAACTVAIPARAADPIYPPGSRVGLVPPAGMTVSDSFAGFADPDKNAAILITILPAEAYAHVEKSLEPEALKKQGISIEKRETMQLAVGKAILIVGRQVVDKDHFRKWLLVAAANDLTALVGVQVPENDSAYPDSVVRAALASLSVRETVPKDEELRLLPFTIGDLAGFEIVGVLPRRAVILGDPPPEHSKEAPPSAPKEGDAAAVTARMLIAAIPGGPSEFEDRANFARLNFNEIGGINEVHDMVSEPMRLRTQAGYQTMAHATDARTGTPVMVVQWLRFGGGGFLQLTAVAPAENWTGTLSRLRAVRDSVETR